MGLPYICTFVIPCTLLIYPAYGGSMLIQSQNAWHHTPEESKCQDELWWSLIHTLPPSTTMILSQWTTYFIWWAIISIVLVGNKLHAMWFSIPSSSSSTVASGSSSTSTWQHMAWLWHFYRVNYLLAASYGNVVPHSEQQTLMDWCNLVHSTAPHLFNC